MVQAHREHDALPRVKPDVGAIVGLGRLPVTQVRRRARRLPLLAIRHQLLAELIQLLHPVACANLPGRGAKEESRGASGEKMGVLGVTAGHGGEGRGKRAWPPWRGADVRAPLHPARLALSTQPGLPERDSPSHRTPTVPPISLPTRPTPLAPTRSGLALTSG